MDASKAQVHTKRSGHTAGRCHLDGDRATGSNRRATGAMRPRGPVSAYARRGGVSRPSASLRERQCLRLHIRMLAPPHPLQLVLGLTLPRLWETAVVDDLRENDAGRPRRPPTNRGETRREVVGRRKVFFAPRRERRIKASRARRRGGMRSTAWAKEEARTVPGAS